MTKTDETKKYRKYKIVNRIKIKTIGMENWKRKQICGKKIF